MTDNIELPDGSQVFSFRLHPLKDREAFLELLKAAEMGLDTRQIVTDRLNRAAGIEPEMYHTTHKSVTVADMQLMLQEFGEQLLDDLIEFVTTQVVADVRRGRIDPIESNPYEDVGGEEAYRQEMMNLYRSRSGKGAARD